MNDARPTGKDAEKYKAIDALLVDEYVLVHINTAVIGVNLPEHLKSQPTVTLKLSRFFRKPLFLGKESVRAELLFNGEYFPCVAPWDSIWGVTSIKGEGKVWVESVPEGVLKELAKVAPNAMASARAVAETKPAPVPSPKPAHDAAPKEKKRRNPATSHLRRVK